MPVVKDHSRIHVEWVRQEHKSGCVIASLAMVMGRTYQDLHDELAPQIWWYDSTSPYPEGREITDEEREARWHKGNDFADRGICLDDAIRWLQTKGYATQLRYAAEWGRLNPDIEWPPKPFAPVHIAQVETSMSHAIVIDRTGKIFDPNREPGTWEESLSFYKKINCVYGIWKVAKNA